MRRFAGLLAVVVAIGVSLCASNAFARGAKHAAMVLDANTGAILHNDDGDERRHPASLTKMMTLYLTFETIDQGRMSMSSPVKISQEAANVAPSKLELEPGEEITVREAILALITKSANDVAVALAEKIGGTQANFVRLMNAKARTLGMSKTNFENPNGLPDPEQVTSARDMITLGLHLQDDFPEHYRLFATRVFTHQGRSYRNHNTLMNQFAGIDGIKTGYTQASGFNLVSSVRRNGRHVLAAVFGGHSAAARNAEMRNLLNRALSRASATKTRKPAPALIAKLKAEPKLAERPHKTAKHEVVADARPAPKRAPRKIEFTPEKPAAPSDSTDAPAESTSEPETFAANTVREAANAEDLQVAEAPEPAPAPAPVAAAEPAAAPSPIALAKVRRVTVAPRQGPPPPKASETTDMASEEPLPDPSVSETIVPKVGGPAMHVAAAAPPPASMLGARDVVPERTAAPIFAASEAQAVIEHATIPPKPASITSAALSKKEGQKSAAPTTASTTRVPQVVAHGTAPSTFEAQASALKPEASASKQGAPPQRFAALMPAQAAPAAGSTGRFEVQIGAYASVNEAQRAISAVQTKTGTLLANYPSVTQPVSKAGRQIIRARFRGFDAKAAAATCQKLRQSAFDCFVMTAE